MKAFLISILLLTSVAVMAPTAIANPDCYADPDSIIVIQTVCEFGSKPQPHCMVFFFVNGVNNGGACIGLEGDNPCYNPVIDCKPHSIKVA